MANNKHNVDTKTLVIVLSSLLLLAVALVIAIVFLPINNQESNDDGDNTAEECLQAENEGKLADCLDEKAFSYYEEGDCEKALKVYDDAPKERFSKYGLSDLYNEAYAMSNSCEDEALINYWAEKYEAVSSQLEGVD